MALENDGNKENVEKDGANVENSASDSRASRDEGEVDYGRRNPLSDRRSGMERRKSNDPAPGEERRSGMERRVVLSNRRAPIDRRDAAFFDEFDDGETLGGK